MEREITLSFYSVLSTRIIFFISFCFFSIASISLSSFSIRSASTGLSFSLIESILDYSLGNGFEILISQKFDHSLKLDIDILLIVVFLHLGCHPQLTEILVQVFFVIFLMVRHVFQ